MAFETIIVEFEDHVALIKLNRPDALNALNQHLLGELMQALEEASGTRLLPSMQAHPAETRLLRSSWLPQLLA